jgi:hypothetical protein
MMMLIHATISIDLMQFQEKNYMFYLCHFSGSCCYGVVTMRHQVWIGVNQVVIVTFCVLTQERAQGWALVSSIKNLRIHSQNNENLETKRNS